jgi:hypothetical protein
MFQVDKPIQLCGFGVYTGIGTHSLLVELLKNDQLDSKILTRKFTFSTKKSNVIQALEFDHAISLDQNMNYTLKILIEGPNTFQHLENGVESFKHEESGVEWKFSKSSLDENGTDVNMGQIPIFYFK